MNMPPMSSLSSLASSIPIHEETAPSGSGGEAFGKLLHELLSSNTQANDKANQAIASLATGDAQDVHTVSLAVIQADLSFRLIMELRNRLTTAYQEVMSMQI